MRCAIEEPNPCHSDLQDLLHATAVIGLSSIFNIERIIDEAERGDLLGLWW